MESFTHKTLVTKPENLTYSYYLSPGFADKVRGAKATLVFCHGYPDNAQMWAGALPRLLQLPYPIVLMDILGLGFSSKPTEPKMYNYLQQAGSIAQVLEHEGVPNNVIPIGHDWGSAISQRFYLYQRARCIGLGLLSLAYQIPSPDAFSLEAANAQTEKRFGYPQWEYWNFFTAPDAPALMEANLGRMYEVLHGLYPDEHGRDTWMREMFCVPGAMRDYVAGQGKWAGYTVPLKPYAENQALRDAFVQRMTRDGFAAPVCYYHSLKNNTMLDEEREHLCQAQDNKKIDVPLLYIGQTGDWVCRTDLMVDAKDAGLLTTDVEEHAVQAGHWVLYEKPDEIARIIADWLTRKFPST